MRSLWFRLMGAFVLVILIGLVVDSFLVSRTTSFQFDRYVTKSGQAWAESLAPSVADHYARTGSWQGVETVLRNPWQRMMGVGTEQAAGRSSNSWRMGPDMMQSTPSSGERGWGWREQDGQGMMGCGSDCSTDWDTGGMMDGDVWGGMGISLLLADDQGIVIADTASSAIGEKLTPAELAAGTPLLVEGQQVGTLLAVSAPAGVATPAGDFLSEVNRSTWLAGLVASGLALVLGLLLFRQIVAPVRGLTAAAQQIAAGRLDRRVTVSSQDEIGQLAGAFNQMTDALARDQQLRRNMMADIAHELRTPLSVILANLEAMLDGVLPTSSEEVVSLHDEAKLLSRLVADLRLLSLAEAGQLKLQRTSTDLNQLVRRATEQMRLQAESSGVDLVTDGDTQLPSLNVDADRIAQVINNLLSNALRYTPAGGQVTVRATTQSQSGNQPEVIVAVTDNGSGIPSEDLPHIFDRFYRTDKSRSRASGGSGIGLAIVKQLVEVHGGRVWAESRGPDQGSTFTFSLPIVA